MRFFILFLLTLCACSSTSWEAPAPAEEPEAEEQPFEVRASVTITSVGEAFEAIAECPEGSSLIEGYCSAPGAIIVNDAEHHKREAWRCAAYVDTERYVRVRATAVCE
jgi:hypothetical protein